MPKNEQEPPTVRAQRAASDPTSRGGRYVVAWIALLVLTGLSYGADQLHLGSLTTAIALGVALVKASIVFIVFMHLDREPFPIRFVAGLNVAWVLMLCLGIAADVALVARGGPPSAENDAAASGVEALASGAAGAGLGTRPPPPSD
jgi:cytochrome c oxidase subunit 4